MNFKRFFVLFLAFLLFFTVTGCRLFSPDDGSTPSIVPFSNGGNERNMIVVISDVHLGAEIAYTECKDNLGSLERLLNIIKASPNVKELVIAGDLFDEWFVPATVDTYQGKDQADFLQRIAVTNKGVIDALNSIIQAGEILVTYVPGNHDLTVTAANVSLVLPGVNQARDAMQGLGRYSPAGNPQIVIEHGHRYNFFCAPDPISNQLIAPGTISPPGYFFTRIAALHVLQNFPPAGDSVKNITENASGDESQDLLFKYWSLWKWAIEYLTIKNKFDEKLIVTNFDGFTQPYSVNDLLPYQVTAGGLIDVSLYNGIQDKWAQRQLLNNVPVAIPAARAIGNASSADETDGQAKIQFFDNPDSDTRIVVFGHSHIAKMQVHDNHEGKKSIYVNSGTWIDHNSLGTTRNFVVITPQGSDASSQTHVNLYNFENEVVSLMAEDSLRF